MTRVTLPGPFSVRPRGNGLWHMTTDAPRSTDIFLRGVEPRRPELLGDPSVTSLELAWRAAGVRITLTRPTGVAYLDAQVAIVHTANGRLYEALPLPGFDAKAKQFWRRIFRLMRIPGGRWLLRFARRNR